MPFTRLGGKQLYRVDTSDNFLVINIYCNIDNDGVYSGANVELWSAGGDSGVFESERVSGVVQAGSVYRLSEESGRAVSFSDNEYGQVSEYTLPAVTGNLGFFTSANAVGDSSRFAALAFLDEGENKVLVSQSGMDFGEFIRASIDEDREEYSFPFSPSPVTTGNVSQFALGEVISSHDLNDLTRVRISRWYFDVSEDLYFVGLVSDSGQVVNTMFGDEQVVGGEASPSIVPW